MVVSVYERAVGRALFLNSRSPRGDRVFFRRLTEPRHTRVTSEAESRAHVKRRTHPRARAAAARRITHRPPPRVDDFETHLDPHIAGVPEQKSER